MDSATQEDTDPYGVSSKPGMPWDTQAPAQYSSKKDLLSLHNSILDAEGEGEVAKNAVGVETMEVNNTEDNKVFKEDHFPDTFRDELLFESEAGRVNSAGHQPPPAKKARQEPVGDDDLWTVNVCECVGGWGGGGRMVLRENKSEWEK